MPDSSIDHGTQSLKPEELTKATQPLTPMSFHISTKDNSSFEPGRRSFFKYRDTGVTAATNGRIRAQVSTCISAMDRETGWHYHLCETQLGYVIKGWVDLQFEDGTEIRAEAGDVMVIPGGTKHNELRTSDDLEALDISLPADMGTVPCEMPDSFTAARKSA